MIGVGGAGYNRQVFILFADLFGGFDFFSNICLRRYFRSKKLKYYLDFYSLIRIFAAELREERKDFGNISNIRRRNAVFTQYGY